MARAHYANMHTYTAAHEHMAQKCPYFHILISLFDFVVFLGFRISAQETGLCIQPTCQLCFVLYLFWLNMPHLFASPSHFTRLNIGLYLCTVIVAIAIVIFCSTFCSSLYLMWMWIIWLNGCFYSSVFVDVLWASTISIKISVCVYGCCWKRAKQHDMSLVVWVDACASCNHDDNLRLFACQHFVFFSVLSDIIFCVCLTTPLETTH